ncbi:DUF3825 domain-containing protein [Streptomyces wuyuanensis]|uniref:DUF3825 domain-containing protein n=1 Tax=Streptomyces wuyuanensis TaxID=1196353 RepID=UPI0036BC076A
MRAPGLGSAHTARPARNAPFDHTHADRVRLGTGLRAGLGSAEVFDHLADIAEPENWDGADVSAQGGKLILRNYIRWTFDRAVEQDRVARSSDGQYSAFNTGLVTTYQESVYGLFRHNERPIAQPWYFLGWRLARSPDFTKIFSPALRPEYVTYTENPADYIYDWRRELEVNVDEFVNDDANFRRYPPLLLRNRAIARSATKDAVNSAADAVRRNYRVAVPCWNPVRNTVELLLPLRLLDVRTVDLALAVSCRDQRYRALTVLTPGAAYTAARLLARPDSDWLQPAAGDNWWYKSPDGRLQ